MPALSPARQSVPVCTGLNILGRGKVRDSYELDSDNLLFYASDGISIFDFVLNALVPQKGMVLTALSHFWLKRLEDDLGIQTHLVAAGAAIDSYVSAGLRGIPALQSQSMVVRKLRMTDVEFIARGFLTGSGLESYKKDGTVCGIRLPAGLQDGDRLPQVIATPTTKAHEGHDEALDAAAVQQKYPEETELLLRIYEYGREEARKRGIVLADTKLEFGRDTYGNLVVGDEVMTPDSSRWWDWLLWHAGRTLQQRKAPPSKDKQLVREWGKEQGIHKLDPLNPEHVRHVHSLTVPDEVIMQTTATYRHVCEQLTGVSVETYFAERLGVVL